MSNLSDNFSRDIAPPGHVTFSVLDQSNSGHSMSIASDDYLGLLRTIKSVLSDLDRAMVFEGARVKIRQSVGCSGVDCRCKDDDLLFAGIAALLKHPDKRTRKKILAEIRIQLRNVGGAHIVLMMPPNGPSAWIIKAPGDVSH